MHQQRERPFIVTQPDSLTPHPHRFYEDVLAIVVATALVALGLTIYAQATLLTGSTAGLALLVQYAMELPFGWVFFVLNLPFYILSLVHMGWKFTLRTFSAVALVSFFASHTGKWIEISHLDPLYAALAGGTIIGVGLLILFRHRASLGGVNILVLFLQERFGLRAGYVQLAIDAAILLGGLFVVPPDRVALSLLGAVAINLVLALNHRPGRYIGVS